MKRTWKTACVLSSALCLLVVTESMGQERQPGQQNAAQRQQQAGQKQVCLASKLTEMSIKDKSNQQLGQIQDLVIDQQGKVQYLAISMQSQEQARTPGQAQQGGKLTLVPFEAVEIHEGQTEAQNYVSLKNLDKDKLTQAPSFTKQQLSGQSAQWMTQVDQFFERETSGAARPDLNQRERQQQQQRQQQQRQQQERNE